MAKLFQKRSGKIGLPPGTIVHLGDHATGQTACSQITYNTHKCCRSDAIDPGQIDITDTTSTTWVRVEGINHTEVIEQIGAGLGVHGLTLEDIVNTDQRPKLDDFDDYLFVVIKTLPYDKDTAQVNPQQCSFLVGSNWLVSFHEQDASLFEPIVQRINIGKGPIRSAGAGYLLYALIDAIVDHYYITLEQIGEHIEQLERYVLEQPDPAVLRKVHDLRAELIAVRKVLWPLREIVSSLCRYDSDLVSPNVHVYMRDVYDHVIHVMERLDAFYEMTTALLDTYMSNNANRMNEVMKVLTIIATIFIPLTFIAGIYGMNFTNMPELHWQHGYFIILSVMGVLGIVMFIFFKRRHWL